MVQEIYPDELKELQKKEKNLLLIDIRPKNMFDQFHVEGSINLDVYHDVWNYDMDTVQKKFEDAKLPKDRKIITICNVGQTSKIASHVLASMGYNTASLAGGVEGWE